VAAPDSAAEVTSKASPSWGRLEGALGEVGGEAMAQPLEEPARQGNIGAAKVSGDSLRNGNLIGQQNGYVVRPQCKFLCLIVDDLSLMADDN